MDSSDLWNFFVCGEVANIFDKETIGEHFRNLCAKVGVECKKHLFRAQEASQTRDWVEAYSEWTKCGDVIWSSKDVIDTDDWVWLKGCHALVLANLSAFHVMDFVRALRAAMEASKSVDQIQNLDFKSCVESTLWMVIYLWASTSGCEEEALDVDVVDFLEEFLIGVLENPEDVRNLKSQSEEFVMNISESVLWKLQKYFFHYSNTGECLRWVHAANDLYEERYPGKLDYVSKFNQASTFFMLGTCENTIQVLEEIRDDLVLKPWEGNDTNVHPATRYCTLQYAFLIHLMLCMCYEVMILQPGERRNSQKMSDDANKERDECQSLWARMQSDGILLPSRKLLAEAWEHATNNRWEKAKRCFGTSRGKSTWDQVLARAFLDKLLTHYKIKYRQSYESGSPDESHFSSAESWAGKLLESNCFSLCPISQWQPRNFMKLVRLYHEKDRQVMFLTQPPTMVNERERARILEYGRRVVDCYMEALVQHTEYDDYWIVVQELYKDLYYMLQFHNFALWIESHGCTLSKFGIEFPDRLQQLWNQTLMSEGASMESTVWQEVWKQSLVWAERRVGKTIYFQLGRNMLSSSTTDQLREFDLNDEVAWNTLKDSRAACGPRTVVLEYSVSKSNDLQFVYVMTKEDKVFMQILKINGLDRIFWKLLEWLRTMFSKPSHECEKGFINACLEWMYEMLISPVANFLDGMEQEDKLIIVAPEILNNVPFAALRKPNSRVGEGYLIQSHTISVTPSLRMLHHCNQRLEDLKLDGLLDRKPGTIVAVGDPTCKERLEASGEEVNNIVNFFGKEHVKKLVGPEATPSEVLKWAKYPTEHRVKQVIFHIAAHGIGEDDDGKVKQGAIVLAPPSTCQENCGPEAIPLTENNGNFDCDNGHNETNLGASMEDVKEETQISSHGEVGAVRTGIVVPISEDTPDTLKSENISGCGFQWKAHMVVLSACDTARGEVTGEGVLNLPRALMIVGVPTVVVSQWKVRDQSTCKLMKGFYGELSIGKDVSSSLRGAMLEMIKEKRKVREWAPFFVCGLPTVCVLTELQPATSSCKGHESGTSRHTKAESRVNDVKVKPLDEAGMSVERLFKLAGSNPDTCLDCLNEFGMFFGLIDEEGQREFRMMQKIEREVDGFEYKQ